VTLSRFMFPIFFSVLSVTAFSDSAFAEDDSGDHQETHTETSKPETHTETTRTETRTETTKTETHTESTKPETHNTDSSNSGSHGDTSSNPDQGGDSDSGEGLNDVENSSDPTGQTLVPIVGKSVTQDQARAAIDGGKVASLPLLLAFMKNNYPGEVLDVKLRQNNTVYSYEVKYLAKSNVLRVVALDGRTLKKQ
jgi:uncharacterized membrane protein YkoI